MQYPVVLNQRHISVIPGVSFINYKYIEDRNDNRQRLLETSKKLRYPCFGRSY